MNGFLGLPVQASSYAQSIDFGIYLIHWAMFAIFAVWGVFFAYLLVRYRRRDGVPAQREEEHGVFKSLLPDIIVMLFEVGLIVFYAIPVWTRIKIDTPKPEEKANEIAVVAEQFAWNVHYPGPDGKFGRRDPKLIHFSNPLGLDRTDPAAADDVTGANEIHIPLGRKTLIRLSSKDVIHSFFVPAFRIKQDAVPGMAIPVWLEPTMTGKFEISCAQLCGFAHSLMRGDVIVETQEDYDKWLASQSAAAPKPQEKASEAW